MIFNCKMINTLISRSQTGMKRCVSTSIVHKKRRKSVNAFEKEGEFICNLPDGIVMMISEYLGNDSVKSLGKMSSRTYKNCWNTWSRYEPVSFNEYEKCTRDKKKKPYIRLTRVKGFDLENIINITSETFKYLTHLDIHHGDVTSSALPRNLQSLQVLWGTLYLDQKLPQSLDRLYIEVWQCTNDLQPGDIPASVKSLNMGSFNQPLQVGVLPASVTSLNMGSFNQPLQVGVLPASVKSLNMGSFNQPLQVGVLPSSVTTFIMSKFNQPLTIGVLPTSVTSLNMRSFNQPLTVSVIPESVTSLIMSKFNHPLHIGVIPSSVLTLDIYSFNHPLQIGFIPSSVTTLDMGNFNQNLQIGVSSGFSHYIGNGKFQPTSPNRCYSGFSHVIGHDQVQPSSPNWCTSGFSHYVGHIQFQPSSPKWVLSRRQSLRWTWQISTNLL